MRPNPKSRRSAFLGACLAVGLLLLSGGYVYSVFSPVSLHDTLNPMYWWRRARGEDLYSADTAFFWHGNRSRPEVALTFDDGPHAASRGRILAVLKQYGVHAAFFDVGMRMRERPDLVLQTLAEGNEEANHTYNHYRLDTLKPDLSHREINDADIEYCRITGKHLLYMRPPGMRFNAEVLKETRRLGYVVVGYSSLSGDYDPIRSADAIIQRTLRRVDNGGIILMHDYPETADALPRILEELKRRGYQIVTLSEMLNRLPARERTQALTYVNGQ